MGALLIIPRGSVAALAFAKSQSCGLKASAGKSGKSRKCTNYTSLQAIILSRQKFIKNDKNRHFDVFFKMNETFRVIFKHCVTTYVTYF